MKVVATITVWAVAHICFGQQMILVHKGTNRQFHILFGKSITFEMARLKKFETGKLVDCTDSTITIISRDGQQYVLFDSQIGRLKIEKEQGSLVGGAVLCVAGGLMMVSALTSPSTPDNLPVLSSAIREEWGRRAGVRLFSGFAAITVGLALTSKKQIRLQDYRVIKSN